MSIRIQPSRIPAGEAPNAQELVPDSAATFVKGDAVRLQADSEVEIHPLTTTVVNIYGFSGEDVTSGVATNPSGEVVIFKADRNVVFMGQMTDTGVVKTALAGNVNIGDVYGLLIVGGETFVDFNDTTNVVVEITDFDDDLDIVFFKVIESALQQP